jgi:hypothetical protein
MSNMLSFSTLAFACSLLLGVRTVRAQSNPDTPPPADAAQPTPSKPVKAAALAPPSRPSFVDVSTRWPDVVIEGINECKTSMDCPTLKDLKASHAGIYDWIKGWCLARGGTGSPNTDEAAICAGTAADSDVELGQLSIYQLAIVAALHNPPTCSGFSLTIPLYSIRYGANGTDVKGPVAAGLGGGYYWARACRDTFSAGLELFGYSEGLDPSGLFHIGVGTGVQIIAYKFFQFGIAAGYDLYRREPGLPTAGMADLASDASKTGLLTGSFHKSDWSALLTFSVTGTSTAPTPTITPPTN